MSSCWGTPGWLAGGEDVELDDWGGPGREGPHRRAVRGLFNGPATPTWVASPRLASALIEEALISPLSKLGLR